MSVLLVYAGLVLATIVATAAGVRTFLEVVAKDIAVAKTAGDPAGIGAALEPAVQDLQGATIWLAQHAASDPDNAGAGAYAYMDLMGLVSLGWMWLKMARAASDAIASGDGKEGRDFYDAKLTTARFYAQRELPLCRVGGELIDREPRALGGDEDIV